MWGFVPRLAEILLTQRSCRSFLLSKATGDVWNSNASYPHPAHRVVSSPFSLLLLPTLCFALYFSATFILSTATSENNNCLKHLRALSTLLFLSPRKQCSIRTGLTLHSYSTFSGKNNQKWSLLSRWTIFILDGRSGLLYTYIIPHIYCSWSPVSKPALLAAVQVMTSQNSKSVSTTHNQNFFLSRCMSSLSPKFTHSHRSSIICEKNEASLMNIYDITKLSATGYKSWATWIIHCSS